MNKKKVLGAVYTPSSFAKYIADKTKNYYEKINGPFTKNTSVLDPACGDGELLKEIYKSTNGTSQLFGIDLDAEAVKASSSHFGKNIVNDNFLVPNGLSFLEGWKKLVSNKNFPSSFDIIIANPPWGACTQSYKEKLKLNQFELMTRQADTSDLFIEASLSIVKENGIIAFIIPDSIFALERDNLRKMLLSKCNILFLGRFGEKLFKGVNRACAVIICQKANPNLNHEVECLRLVKNSRDRILSNESSFSLEEKLSKLNIKQKRFLENNNYQFNLELVPQHEDLYKSFKNFPKKIGDYLTSTRGVELSKKGNVINCVNCNYWQPLVSKKDGFTCKHCGHENLISSCEIDCIISPTVKGKKIIVGEHITRYCCSGQLFIDDSKTGIKYKDPKTYLEHKIVVRKTGLGVSATIDYSEAMTNQVVYIFKVREKIQNSIPIEFLLMILCSRAVFFFIAMSGGEIEWKSHPYLTQSQLLNLPVPNLLEKYIENKKFIDPLAVELKKLISNYKEIPVTLDAKIELLVSKIYGFTRADYEKKYAMLKTAENLKPIQALKRVSIEQIFRGTE
ncbi:N-6 DNA methylase [Pseudoalteromonas sp.]|uniref:N-6 DNA methylase n=1 Tax=Pseudoalteromonas sp. TaxID=53249 RepID=UPI001BCED9F1|nr:N-6 DNA methylase [Pseudoalteromonas sp.]